MLLKYPVQNLITVENKQLTILAVNERQFPFEDDRLRFEQRCCEHDPLMMIDPIPKQLVVMIFPVPAIWKD